MVLFALAVAALVQPIESVTITEGECASMIQRDEEVVTTTIPGLYIIGRTAQDERLDLGLPAGAGVACPRSSIIPAFNDWKVLAAGHPLYILETGVPAPQGRIGALEVSEGQFRYRLVRGALRGSEPEQVSARLDHFQANARD